MPKDITVFKTSTADRILKKMQESKNRTNMNSGITGVNEGFIDQEYITAVIVEEKVIASKSIGYYKMQEVVRDDRDLADYDNHKWFPGMGRTFIGYEVGGLSGLAVDPDKAYVCFSTVAASGNTIWNFKAGGEGGGGTRAYVKITQVISPNRYFGNVIAGVYDSTILIANVDIRIPDATANPLSVNDTAFADVTRNAANDGDIYIVEGFVLG